MVNQNFLHTPQTWESRHLQLLSFKSSFKQHPSFRVPIIRVKNHQPCHESVKAVSLLEKWYHRVKISESIFCH